MTNFVLHFLKCFSGRQSLYLTTKHTCYTIKYYLLLRITAQSIQFLRFYHLIFIKVVRGNKISTYAKKVNGGRMHIMFSVTLYRELSSRISYIFWQVRQMLRIIIIARIILFIGDKFDVMPFDLMTRLIWWTIRYTRYSFFLV